MEKFIIAIMLVLTTQSTPVYTPGEISEIKDLCFAHEGKQRFNEETVECMTLLPNGNWVTVEIDLRDWEYEDAQPLEDNDAM